MGNLEKNLQGKSFKDQNLQNSDFSGANLCGADFSKAVLTNADFSKCKTGLKPISAVVIFIFAMVISLLSGYIAMLTGSTVQIMLKSPDTNIFTAGYITIGLIIIFILLAIWKGGQKTLISVVVTIIAALLVGLVSWLSGAGTGMGSVYASLALILFVLMVIAGTISRTTAGMLASNILFLIVAVGGGMFGKSLGGGIGTVVLAVSCAIISKRILSGASDFSFIRKIALTVGSYFGTSFKDADLTGANFSESIVKNTNFTGTKLSEINWEGSKKKFCIGENTR